MLQNIKMIEIEINSFFVIGSVPWCPNSVIERSGSERFSIELLTQLLKELRYYQFGREWYGGFISFSRNNEPFAVSDQLSEMARLIKEYLPYVNLVSNTNGDYLTEALESEVVELSIMDYDCKGYDYWHSLLLGYGASLCEKTDNLAYFIL